MNAAGARAEWHGVRRFLLALAAVSCAAPPEAKDAVERAVVEHWRTRDREAVVKVEEVRLDGDRAEALVRLSFPALHTVSTVKTVELVRTEGGWKVKD